MVDNSGLGNRMLCHMKAVAMQARYPSAKIINVPLPEWGFDTNRENIPGTYKIHHYDLPREYESININYYNKLYTYTDPPVQPYGDDYIVCHIRTGDIARNVRRHLLNYEILPVSFYQTLKQKTNKELIFIGQTHPSSYITELTKIGTVVSPVTSFVWTGDRSIISDTDIQYMLRDFQILRESKNVCTSSSTFSFVATYLNVVGTIHYPLTRSSRDYLPLNSDKYIPYETPLMRRTTKNWEMYEKNLINE